MHDSYFFYFHKTLQSIDMHLQYLIYPIYPIYPIFPTLSNWSYLFCHLPWTLSIYTVHVSWLRLADARFALHPPTRMMRGWDIFFIPGKSWWWMIEGWPEISRGGSFDSWWWINDHQWTCPGEFGFCWFHRFQMMNQFFWAEEVVWKSALWS